MYFTMPLFYSIPSNQQPFFSSIRPGAWGSKGGVATDQCQLNSSNLLYSIATMLHVIASCMHNNFIYKNIIERVVVYVNI